MSAEDREFFKVVQDKDHAIECAAVGNWLRTFAEKQWRQMRIVAEIERRRMVEYRAFYMGRRHYFEELGAWKELEWGDERQAWTA